VAANCLASGGRNAFRIVEVRLDASIDPAVGRASGIPSERDLGVGPPRVEITSTCRIAIFVPAGHDSGQVNIVASLSPLPSGNGMVARPRASGTEEYLIPRQATSTLPSGPFALTRTSSN
jgi:hypothetical protein